MQDSLSGYYPESYDDQYLRGKIRRLEKRILDLEAAMGAVVAALSESEGEGKEE